MTLQHYFRLKLFLSNTKALQRFNSHSYHLGDKERRGGERLSYKSFPQKSLAAQRCFHLRAGDRKSSPIGSTLRLFLEINKIVMMKAGHSSRPGSNENVSVLRCLKTDNSTALQELFNVYHHLQGLKCRQRKEQQKKSSYFAQNCKGPVIHDCAIFGYQ